jgi:hypothetical protein
MSTPSLTAALLLCLSLTAYADPQPQPWRTADEMEAYMARIRASSNHSFEIRDSADLAVLRKINLAHIADAYARMDARSAQKEWFGDSWIWDHYADFDAFLADFKESAYCPGSWVVTAPANPGWGNWNITDPASWWTGAGVKHCMEAPIHTVYCRDPDCNLGFAFKYRKVWQLRPTGRLAQGPFLGVHREGEYAWYVDVQEFAYGGGY